MRKLLLAFVFSAVISFLSASPAFADACFDEQARLAGGIGPTVGGIASGLAQPGVPGSTVPTADPALLNQIKNAVCPQP